jgi:hypothetical protein
MKTFSFFAWTGPKFSCVKTFSCVNHLTSWTGPSILPYIHIYIKTRYIYPCVHKTIFMYIHTYVCTYIQIYRYMYIHPCVNAALCIYGFMYIHKTLYMYICIYIQPYLCIYGGQDLDRTTSYK